MERGRHNVRTIVLVTVLSMVVILSSAPGVRADNHTPAAGPSQLKIVTINAWLGMEAHGYLRLGECENKEQRDKRYEALVAGLREYDPDIVFLQEANPIPTYVLRLVRDLKMDRVYAVNSGGVRIARIGAPLNLRMGIAILAKPHLGLKRVGAYRTSGAGIVSNFFCLHLSEVRVLLAGVIYPHGEPVYLFCFHVSETVPNNNTYRTELAELAKGHDVGSGRRISYADALAGDFETTEEEILRGIPYIEELTRNGGPFIAAGNFNATVSDFPSLKYFMNRLRLIDSFALLHPDRPGYTWDPYRNPNVSCEAAERWADGTVKDPLERLRAEYVRTVPRRIDYIFLSSQFQPEDVLSSELVFTEPHDGTYASDHFGVMTDVRLK